MRPVPIPDDLIWEGARRVVFAPPDGDPTGEIRPVETLVDVGQSTGHPRICVRLVLEDGDLERLAEDPHVWLTWYGDHLHPFDVVVVDPEGAPDA
jgi:hypothetical protein